MCKQLWENETSKCQLFAYDNFFFQMRFYVKIVVYSLFNYSLNFKHIKIKICCLGLFSLFYLSDPWHMCVCVCIHTNIYIIYNIYMHTHIVYGYTYYIHIYLYNCLCYCVLDVYNLSNVAHPKSTCPKVNFLSLSSSHMLTFICSFSQEGYLHPNQKSCFQPGDLPLSASSPPSSLISQ